MDGHQKHYCCEYVMGKLEFDGHWSCIPFNEQTWLNEFVHRNKLRMGDSTILSMSKYMDYFLILCKEDCVFVKGFALTYIYIAIWASMGSIVDGIEPNWEVPYIVGFS